MSSYRWLSGFVAGFLATLVFHQLMVAVLWSVGVAPFAPFPVDATAPFGVPSILSLAFWGGVWGIAYVGVERRFPRGGNYWLAAFLFGGILPSLVALLVVAPLKGGPVGGGADAALLLVALLVNGAWGVGTGVFLGLVQRMMRRA